MKMTPLQKMTLWMLLVNFLIVAYFGFLLLWPVKFPIIYNEPFPLNKSEVKKGDHITYTIEYEKFKQYEVDSHQNIICEDGNLVTLAPNRSNFPLGRHFVEITVVVPQKASISRCYIELSVAYRINPIRTETRTMHTQYFSIVE